LSHLSTAVNSDDRGSLCAINFKELNFEPKRFFWIFGVPLNISRAGHAHKTCKQILICQNGTIKISILDFNLNSSDYVLNPGDYFFLDKLNWLEINFLSSDALLGVFASEPYDRSEYIDDIEDFKNAILS